MKRKTDHQPDRQERLYPEKVVEQTRTNLVLAARGVIDLLRANPTRPKGMDYFDKVVLGLYQEDADLSTGKNREKLIGTFCLSTPEELIYAAGAVPVRLSAGIHATTPMGEDYLPVLSCPIVKSTVGLFHLELLSIYKRCKLVIIPTTCDWMKKIGEILRNHIPVWTLEVPQVRERESARRHWVEEVYGLKREIERFTGSKITKNRLREAIRLIQRAQLEFRRLYRIRMTETPVISGSDAMLIMNAYFYDEVDRWTAAMSRLNDELEERLRERVAVCPKNVPRIMLTGSPIIFPNWKLPHMIEEAGGIIVCDDLCSSNRYIYDPIAIDESTMPDMMIAIAERYLLPCTCPRFSPNNDRIERILQMVEDFRVTGVIYHVLRGCHLYDFEERHIHEILQEKGIPQIKIETDYSLEDRGQVQTRIEAFLEILQGKESW